MFRKTVSMVIALSMCLTLFVGCGEQEPAPTPVEPDVSVADSTEVASADEEITSEEGTLVWNMGADPKTWDPGLNTATDGSHLVNNMFEGLLEDVGGGKLLPAQAESYTISDDKLTYTFKLRPDLKWSDGKPLTANDFEYSWKRVCDPATASEFANLMTSYIEGAMEYLTGEGTRDEMAVKALDDLTLEVKLKNPVPYFLNLCSFYTYYPVREDMVATGDGWEKKAATCVSNGPFKMSDYKTAEKVVMVKNDNYRNAADVSVEKVEALMIVESTTAFNGYKAGKIHILESSGIPTNEIPKLEATDPYFTIAPQAGTWYLIFNMDMAPFDNVLVRRAFTLAIDNKKITDIIKGGRLPATGFIAPVLHFSDGVSCRKLDEDGMPTPEYGIDPMKANAEEAKKLLAEAGYPNGEGLPEISYNYNTNDGNKLMAEALQEMWSQNLGIDVKLKNEEWAVFQDSRHSGDFMMARGAWVSDYDDPMSLLELFTEHNGNNDAQWRSELEPIGFPHDKILNPEAKPFNDAIDMMQITEGKERDEWIRKAEQELMDNAVVAPVYYYVYNQIVDESVVEGVSRTTMGMWIFKNAKMV